MSETSDNKKKVRHLLFLETYNVSELESVASAERKPPDGDPNLEDRTDSFFEMYPSTKSKHVAATNMNLLYPCRYP